MTLSEVQRFDAATRLIKVVTGEQYGDGMLVTDVGIGYANGITGYRSDVWVTGDWNDKSRYIDGERIVDDNTPSRLFAALERIGVECEWLDEWQRCDDCSKLIRTEPDSYGWLPQYVDSSDGMICRECATADAETFVSEHYANRPTTALTWLGTDELESLGYRDAFPSERAAENGWHPGQDDTPDAMVKRLKRTVPLEHVDYVFIITDKGQFDLHFRLFIRYHRPDWTGCLVDGTWGQYGVARMIAIAAGDYGYRDDEVTSLAASKLAAMMPSDAPQLSDDDEQALADSADEVENWLNEHVAESGYLFGWHDGEFFYQTEEWWSA